MPLKPFLRVTFLLATIIIVGVFCFFYIQNTQPKEAGVMAHFQAQKFPQHPDSTRPVQMEVNLPMRLKIPKIKVDALIEEVGLTSDGSMATPSIPEDVGWYKFGKRPGEKGSAVIDGHLDAKNAAPAVFYDLQKLQAGDEISVIDNSGTSTSFIVRETRTYDAGADTGEIFSPDNGIYLNLITCDGAWDSGRKEYNKRLVVFADATPK